MAEARSVPSPRLGFASPRLVYGHVLGFGLWPQPQTSPNLSLSPRTVSEDERLRPRTGVRRTEVRGRTALVPPIYLFTSYLGLRVLTGGSRVFLSLD